jgi:DNA-binding CsgD family transcriptional regulator
MSVSTPNVDELILAIHSASFDPDGWNHVGRSLLKALSAHSGIGLRGASKRYPESWALNMDVDPSAASAYADYWGGQDIWYKAAVRAQRIRTALVSVDSHLANEEERSSSEFINEYLRPLEISRMIQVCLAEPDASGFGAASLNLYRGVGEAPFSSDDVELLSILAPHLAVAAKNFWMVQSLRLLGGARASALDAVSSAVFAIRSQKLVFSNGLGDELIRQQRWIRVSNGTLAAAPGLISAIPLATALHRASIGIGSTTVVTDRATGDEAQVSVIPIRPGIDMGFLIAAPSALVWIIPLALRKDTGQDMALLFGLTRAERRVLEKLLDGMDLRLAATELGISIHTARTQLKSILHKTGRRSQSALLMLTARVASLSSVRE